METRLFSRVYNAVDNYPRNSEKANVRFLRFNTLPGESGLDLKKEIINLITTMQLDNVINCTFRIECDITGKESVAMTSGQHEFCIAVYEAAYAHIMKKIGSNVNVAELPAMPAVADSTQKKTFTFPVLVAYPPVLMPATPSLLSTSPVAITPLTVLEPNSVLMQSSGKRQPFIPIPKQQPSKQGLNAAPAATVPKLVSRNSLMLFSNNAATPIDLQNDRMDEDVAACVLAATFQQAELQADIKALEIKYLIAQIENCRANLVVGRERLATIQALCDKEQDAGTTIASVASNKRPATSDRAAKNIKQLVTTEAVLSKSQLTSQLNEFQNQMQELNKEEEELVKAEIIKKQQLLEAENKKLAQMYAAKYEYAKRLAKAKEDTPRPR